MLIRLNFSYPELVSQQSEYDIVEVELLSKNTIWADDFGTDAVFVNVTAAVPTQRSYNFLLEGIL